jgi:hypothetical protein
VKSSCLIRRSFIAKEKSSIGEELRLCIELLPLELKKEIGSFDGKIENPRENDVT